MQCRVFYLLFTLAWSLLGVGASNALPGDINRDGTVDFADFFLLADDFGRSGPPEIAVDTVFVVRRDTLERIVEVPILLRDTVYVDLGSLGALGQVLSFADPNLEAAVRAAIGRASGPLFEQHVQSLTFLDASGRNIALLSGIEDLGALTSLSLSDNQIVSLAPLRELVNMASLNLSNNRIRSLGALVANAGLGDGASVVLLGNPLGVTARTVEIPALSARGVQVERDASVITFADTALESAVRNALDLPTGDLLTLDLALLTELHLSNRGITTLGGIEYLVELTELVLSDNQIVDLQALSGLSDLTLLRLDGNQIVDLSPLKKLTGLSELKADNNQIEELEGLRGLTGLRVLNLANNQIDNLGPLAELTALRDVRLQNNAIENIGPLASLLVLDQLDLSSNRIVDISPLLSLTSLDDLWLAGNTLGSPSVLTHIPALEASGTFVRF